MGRDSKAVNYSDKFILHFRRTLGAGALLFVILFIAEFASADISVSPPPSVSLVQGCFETDNFSVTNDSDRYAYVYTFATSPYDTWMSVSPLQSCTFYGGGCALPGVTQTFPVSFSAVGAPGTYTGNITVSYSYIYGGGADSGSGATTATLTILYPDISVSPQTVSLSSCNLAPHTVTVTNASPCGQYFSVSADRTWLAVGWNDDYLASGASGTLSVGINPAFLPAGLSPGTYSGNVFVTAGATTKTIPVSLTVNPNDCNGCRQNNEPVGSSANLTSGNLYHSQDVPSMPGSLPLSLAYNSRDITYIGPLGKGWTHSYNVNIINMNGYLMLMKGDGRRTSFVPNGGVYYPVANSGDRSIIIQNADGTYTQTLKDGTIYAFNSSGGLTSIKDRNDNTTTFNYSNNDLVAITDPVGRTVQLTYDTSHRIIQVKGLSLRTTNITYNTSGYISNISEPDGKTWSFTYDAAGNMSSKTDPEGNVTTYTYDTGGKLVTSTTPLGIKTISYDQANNKATVTERDGTIWQHTYDPGVNAPVEIKAPDNTTKSRAYDANGHLTSETDEEGNTSSYTYDSDGNMLTFTDPLNNTTSYTYNQWGQVTSVTDGSGDVTTLTYDDRGNLLGTTDPLGNTSTMIYDLRGRLITSTDPKGKSTDYTYDAMGNLETVTDQLGYVTQYAYTTDDNIATVTDAKNHMIQYDYDSLGRAAKTTDQLGNMETYTYDQYSNLATVTDRKGQVTTYAYDQMNRITSATYADGSSTSYTYDTLGKLITIDDSIAGEISYEYSTTSCGTGCSGGAIDKVTNETTPSGSISYTYDAVGRKASMTVEGQPSVNYTYDAASRLTGINTQINGTTAGFGVNYDGSGRRSALTLLNGVTTDYSYDEAGRLLNLQHLNSSNTAIESVDYAYDANGNRISIDRSSVNPPEPAAASNILFNAANQMLSFNTGASTYDATGNMTSWTNACGTTNYTWDARNRLVGINGYQPNCASLTASFKYDALNRRIQKTINGRTIQYLYDGNDIVQEIENGAVTVNYVRTLNIDEPLARIEADGTVRYYLADALGSIIALADESGVIVTQYAYEPFGNVIISGEVSDNPFQYTGRENDGTGLYYYRARYYNPELQRFISEDPIGFAGGINLFAYVLNNPTNLVDPAGDSAIIVIGVIVCGVAIVVSGIEFWYWATHPPTCPGDKECLENPKPNNPPKIGGSPQRGPQAPPYYPGPSFPRR